MADSTISNSSIKLEVDEERLFGLGEHKYDDYKDLDQSLDSPTDFSCVESRDWTDAAASPIVLPITDPTIPNSRLKVEVDEERLLAVGEQDGYKSLGSDQSLNSHMPGVDLVKSLEASDNTISETSISLNNSSIQIGERTDAVAFLSSIAIADPTTTISKLKLEVDEDKFLAVGEDRNDKYTHLDESLDSPTDISSVLSREWTDGAPSSSVLPAEPVSKHTLQNATDKRSSTKKNSTKRSSQISASDDVSRVAPKILKLAKCPSATNSESLCQTGPHTSGKKSSANFSIVRFLEPNRLSQRRVWLQEFYDSCVAAVAMWKKRVNGHGVRQQWNNATVLRRARSNGLGVEIITIFIYAFSSHFLTRKNWRPLQHHCTVPVLKQFCVSDAEQCQLLQLLCAWAGKLSEKQDRFVFQEIAKMLVEISVVPANVLVEWYKRVIRQPKLILVDNPFKEGASNYREQLHACVHFVKHLTDSLGLVDNTDSRLESDVVEFVCTPEDSKTVIKHLKNPDFLRSLQEGKAYDIDAEIAFNEIPPKIPPLHVLAKVLPLGSDTPVYYVERYRLMSRVQIDPLKIENYRKMQQDKKDGCLKTRDQNCGGSGDVHGVPQNCPEHVEDLGETSSSHRDQRHPAYSRL